MGEAYAKEMLRAYGFNVPYKHMGTQFLVLGSVLRKTRQLGQLGNVRK